MILTYMAFWLRVGAQLKVAEAKSLYKMSFDVFLSSVNFHCYKESKLSQWN